MQAALRGSRPTLPSKKFSFSLLVIASLTTLNAQTHQSRWEFTESFIRDTWLHPIRTVDVTIAGEGPVHDPTNDCEIHIGAELADQSISDFADIVLEPPNVCKDTRRSSRQAWRDFYHTLADQTCSANGFIRAWPEHLEVGQGASNPPHIMELHPLRRLNCQNNTNIDVKQQLAAHADLGYKTGRQIETLLRTFRLWVRRMPHPDEQSLSTIEFDYYSCTFVANKEKCAFGGSVHNFGRLLVRTIGNTKRCSGGGNNGEEFRTIIGRARARGRTGAPVARSHLTKFYGLPGTNFYDALGDQCSPAGPPTKASFDVLAIFTVDPLAVLKTVEKISHDNQNGQWVEVPFPVAFIVFDEMP
jgi:hypothetical protein